MPALTSIDDFFQTLQRTGLIDRPRLEALLKQLGESPAPPADASAVAALLVRDGLLTTFQARQLLAGKSQGFTILGKYKILDLLGTGGMGKVYLCEHMLLRRLVAVKVLPQSKIISSTAVERFYREARAVAALDHPNIVRCFDIDRDGAVHFMVMEYVDGVGLDQLIQQQGPQTPLRAAHYIRQAVLGLQHAHEAGWVHRDVKPGNILLARDGTIKLLDLGLARLFTDQGDNLTQQFSERAILGTADYIAPEQAVASHEVDIRADIYSLGCTFYYLLTGRPPFTDGTLAQKLIWHQVRPHPPLLQLRPELPAELVAVVDRMLAKEREERYQTPTAVAEALAAWTETPIPPPTEKELPRPASAELSGLLTDLHSVLDSDLWNPPPFVSGGSLSRWKFEPGASSGQQTISARKDNTPPTPPSNPRNSRAASASRAPAGDAAGAPLDPRATIRKLRLPAIGPQDTIRKGVPPSGPLSTMRAAVAVPAPPPQPPAPAPVPSRGASRKAGLLLVGGLLLVALGGGSSFLIFRPGGGGPSSPLAAATPATTRTAPPAGPAPLLVTRNRFSDAWGKPNTFDSLAKAVAGASVGDHIVLLDANIEEQLELDGSKQPIARNLTIESSRPMSDPALWHRPADRPKGAPLLRIVQVEGLTLKGGIAFDGEGEVDTLIELEGRCRGLRLEGVKLSGFKRSAVLLRGCQGEDKQPVTLQSLRFTRKEAVAALVIASGRGSEATRELVVSECRFEGPFTATVQVEGALLTARFTGNRFYQCGDVFQLADTDALLQVELNGNTFDDAHALFHFRALPAVRKTAPFSRVALTSNLFAKVPTLLRIEKGTAEKFSSLFAVCAHNVRDHDSAKDAPAYLPTKEMTFELPTGTTDDQFLRYPPSSDLATAGPNGTPVGVPPR